MTKGSPPDTGNDEFECILLQSGLCVLGFFCSLSTSSSDGICPAVTWQNGFYSWCLQGWPQAAAHLKGFKRKSTSNCHKQLPSMIFFLWLASPLFNSPHLKVAVTSTPTLIFRNSSILPCFIPSFPCSSFMPPQTFMMLLLLSLCFACHLPSAGNHGGYQMLLVLDRYEEFAGVPVSICALPRELYVGGGDKWHEALTRLFQTDNVGRKWTSGCLGCCVLSAVPQIYFTFVGYKDYVKPISSWCPERTVCPYDCCFSFFWGGCFFVVVSLFLFFPVLT